MNLSDWGSIIVVLAELVAEVAFADLELPRVAKSGFSYTSIGRIMADSH